ncbi:MAG: camphor resistance protein CrcB [Rhodobacteraceae bacterium]|nr:MAG: camphor resistance protein CrcB [Paracoccaceae bacterium]
MKTLFLSFVLALGASVASAEMIRVASPYSVAESLDRLEQAVTGAGAKVFARVEHAKGAASIGQDLAPMAVLIFGKPQLGTPAMQVNPLAGVVLPARVLAYEDSDGAVWLAYENPADMLAPFDIPADAKVVMMMTKALGGLTGKAVAK